MNITIQTDPPRDELDDFVDSCAGSTFFHSYGWMDCLVNCFRNFEPLWIIAREEGVIRSLMPVVKIRRGPFNELWSLPFGTYGGPVGGEAPLRLMILDKFMGMSRSWKCVRAGADIFNAGFVDFLPPHFGGGTEECRMVDLEGGFDRFWSDRISRKRRQICNRADRKGITVKPLDTLSELKKLYSLYQDNSSAWGGVHPYPFSLFRELFRRRGRSVVILGAYLKGGLLGGHIDMYQGVMGQAWQAGMSRQANQYGAGPLLIREAVREACNRGMKLFNLGSSGGREGIIFFKESMGGWECNYPVIREDKRWWRWIIRR